jgi:kojibiose phosphorylase
MRIPYDPQTHLFEQFDDYFKLKTLDQSKYKGRKDSYQGLLSVEAVQKYTIIKQADVLMLLTVMKDDFDLETKKANWDFYYPLTDHDYGSSLTPAFHVILACELGKANEAYELFVLGNLVDLENLRGNTPEGIHAACCGAVWQAAVLGFAGLSFTPEGYTTTPHLPDKWTRLAFSFMHKGKLEHIDLHT